MPDCGANRNVAAEPAMPENMAIRAMSSPSKLARICKVHISTNTAIIFVINCVFDKNSMSLSQFIVGHPCVVFNPVQTHVRDAEANGRFQRLIAGSTIISGMDVELLYEKGVTAGARNHKNNKLITASDLITFHRSPFAYWCKLYADKSVNDNNYDRRTAYDRRRLARVLLERRIERHPEMQGELPEDSALESPAADVELAAQGLQFEGDAESGLAAAKGQEAVHPDPDMSIKEQFHDLLGHMDSGAALLAQFPLYFMPERLMGKPDMLHLTDGGTYQVVEVKSHAGVLPEDVLQANFYNYLMENVFGRAHDTVLIRTTSGDSERPYEAGLVTGMLDEMRSLVIAEQPLAIYGGCQYEWSKHNDQTAMEQGNASVLSGVGPAKFRRLSSAGFGTISRIAAVDIDMAARTLKGTGIGRRTLQRLQRHARVLESGTYDMNGAGGAPLPESDVVFLDIETELGTPYMIGLMATDGTYDYVLHSDDMIDRLAGRVNGRTLVHWAAHDSTTLRACGLDADFFDLHKHVRQTYTLPLPRSTIKHVSEWLGFNYQHPYIDYMMCKQLYDDFCESGDRDMLELALSYNRDDCKALSVVYEWCTRNLMR